MPQGQHTPPISAEELVTRLRQGTKDSHEIELRGNKIPVRLLSMDEMLAIRAEARRDNAVANGDDSDYNCRVQKTTLKMATTVPVGSAPYLGDKVLHMLTVDEIGDLFMQYTWVLHRVNPSLEMISPDEFRAMVDAVKKKALTWRELPLKHLRAIAVALQEGALIPASASSHVDNSSGSS